MATATAMFAAEETLVQHNGSARHSWQGVTFEYGTWLRPMQVAAANCLAKTSLGRFSTSLLGRFMATFWTDAGLALLQ